MKSNCGRECVESSIFGGANCPRVTEENLGINRQLQKETLKQNEQNFKAKVK